MNNRLITFALLALVGVLIFTACGTKSPAAPAETMSESASADAMMKDGGDEMAGHDDDSMATESDGDAMMTDDGEMMKEDGDAMMMDAPAWFGAELFNTKTQAAFTVSDFKGKPILVETMAIWCSNCLRQQKEVKAWLETYEGKDDVVVLVLDIDTNDSPDKLKAYAEKHGFSWNYAVAPVDVAREIGNLYGDQYLNPPTTPMLIIDPHGETHLLPFGHKTGNDLTEALTPFLTDNM